jgi:gliding motility-associated-like protein
MMYNRLLLFFVCLISFNSIFAQSFSNKGKDFWVAYGYHVRMNQNTAQNPGNSQDMVLYFATDQATTIQISIPGTGYTQTLQSGPTPTVLTSAPIPKSGVQDARLTDESTSPENKGIHITSDKPMVAYAHIYNQNVSGATILFPTNTLGKEYYSLNYRQTSNEDNSNNWFYVIATDTGVTTVEITPSAATMNRPANVPFTVNLTQGQVFNMMGQLTGGGGPGPGGNTFTGVDLTGSKIKSIASGTGVCKRIAVFSGSGKMYISCNNQSTSADNYMVQAFPKDAWGKKFLTVPTRSLVNNYFRIAVLDPTTVVKINGANIAVPLTNNFYYDYSITNQPLKIEADKPITVAQYIASQGACGNPNANSAPGDPEVIYLSPVEQNIYKVLWNATPNYNILQHYFNVVIPNAGTARTSFRLDGVNIPSSNFITHPQDSRYSYLSLQTSAGVHSIESDSGFNAIAYGFGSAESYGYNAGTNIRDLYNFLEPIVPFSLSPDPVACTGTPVFLAVTFPFQPTSLKFDFRNNPNISPNTNYQVNNPTADSTYFLGTQQVWRYKVPNLYTFNQSNNNPGYLVNVFAGTTNTDGCGSIVEREFSVAIYDPPIAKMGWSNNGCVSDVVQFVDSTNYLDGTFSYRWFWDFGDGTIDSVRYPQHRYLAPGTYTVKFSMISNIGCISDTSIKQITITANPIADFTVVQPSCVGTPVRFNNRSTIQQPGTITKWYWNYGDGFTETSTLPFSGTVSHVYANAGNYQVTLRAETQTGCSSVFDTLSVYVGPYPTPAIISPGRVCLPTDSARFGNSSTISDGSILTYQWTFGDSTSGSNDSSILSTPAHYYSTTGSYNVSLTATSTQGCVADTIIIFSDIYNRVTAEFEGNEEVCAMDTAFFSSIGTAQGNSITIRYWDFGDGSPIDTGTSVSHIYSLPGLRVVRHWTISEVGCNSDTISKNILVNHVPVANFRLTGSDCQYSNVLVRDFSSIGNGNIVSWNWNLGDTLNQIRSTPDTFSTIFSWYGSDTVRLVVTSDKGCFSHPKDSVIEINAKPLAGFKDPDVCLADSYAQFNDTSSIPSGSIISWSWTFGDPASGNNNSSIQQNPQHSYQTIGLKPISLIVTSSQGCTDTIERSISVNGDIPDAIFEVLEPNRLCSNDSISIKDTSTVDIGSIVRVEIVWDLVGAPNVFEVEDNPFPGKLYKHLYPTFHQPATRQYRVKIRSYSGESCVDSTFRDIALLAAPKVQFDPISDTCLYIEPFKLTQAFEVYGMPGTYVYSGTSISAADSSFYPVIAGVGLDTVQFKYSTLTGCSDSATQTILIEEPPIAHFGYMSPFCEDVAVRFSDSSTTPLGTLVAWTWNYGDGSAEETTLQADSVKHIFANSIEYSVQLVVTNSVGCKSLPDTVLIPIQPEPLASFTFSDTVCLPIADVQFNNTTSIADGTEATITYRWSFGDASANGTDTTSLINPRYTYSNLGPFAVTLTATSLAGCIGDTIISVNTIHPQPEANFQLASAGVCEGASIRLTDVSDPKDGTTVAWSWNYGDGNTSDEEDPSHIYADSGNYTISLYITNSFGCVSDTTTQVFRVYPYPIISAGPDLTVLEGEPITIQATAIGNNLQFAWTNWFFLNNYQILNPICTPDNNMTYTLKVTGEGGCISTDEVKVSVWRKPQIPNTFSPNNDGINDYWVIEHLRDYKYAKVKVFTRTGQQVFQSIGYNEPWDGKKNGKALPMDTYYYIIEPGNGRAPITGFVTIIK